MGLSSIFLVLSLFQTPRLDCQLSESKSAPYFLIKKVDRFNTPDSLGLDLHGGTEGSLLRAPFKYLGGVCRWENVTLAFFRTMISLTLQPSSRLGTKNHTSYFPCKNFTPVVVQHTLTKPISYKVNSISFIKPRVRN